jgi:hypothetical protein
MQKNRYRIGDRRGDRIEGKKKEREGYEKGENGEAWGTDTRNEKNKKEKRLVGGGVGSREISCRF